MGCWRRSRVVNKWIRTKRLIYVPENEESQNCAGQAESPVRELVGGMEERGGGTKIRAAESLHEGFGLVETIPVAVGIREGMHNPAAFRHEAVLDVGQKAGGA